jgi:hypothetical protein
MWERAPWVWIPEDQYPEIQGSPYNIISREGRADRRYAVVRFERTYSFGRPVARVSLRAGGDTFFLLTCNGKAVLSGHTTVGGDFLNNSLPRPETFFFTREIEGQSGDFAFGRLSFAALVRLGPTGMYEHSQGHGGFFLSGTVTFDDGTRRTVGTDDGWTVRVLPAYVSKNSYDGRLAPGRPLPAVRVPDIWHASESPVPPCELRELYNAAGRIRLGPHEKLEKTIPFDMVYAAYPAIRGTVAGAARVQLFMSETPGGGEYAEEAVVAGSTRYMSQKLQGVGQIRAVAENLSDEPVSFRIGLILSSYPAPERAVTATSDRQLNRVLDVCAHSLKYCRQAVHLDSPRHCEPLACTGDYYIEMCMTAFTYGDMRLAAADVRRTASLIASNGGRLFHTSYSLIWAEMLWRCYMYTGDSSLLRDCEEALLVLLERFETYVGRSGLIEEPPDYMFVDWLFPDGISLHHPPKALGQTCLCMFYYNALVNSRRVFAELGRNAEACRCSDRAEALREAVCSRLYDRERGLFFEGLNTKEKHPSKWLPENVGKRYYRRHANILAAYSGILPDAECAELLRRVMDDDSLGEVQPYFCHFWLEAVLRRGLREEQTLRLLSMWKGPVGECPKGLPEGFYLPENYVFDHSHAWAGTPAYALPMALTGLEILEPGYRRIRLAPSTLGLARFRTEIPTPFGTVVVEQNRGGRPRLTVPEGITVEMD